MLGILYESFIHPITIISGLPSAGIGAILTLMLFRMDLSVIAMIGIVMLVGIVKKNAIMMIDFAIERRRVGLSAEAAIREAAMLRFRPIMMTTFAAIFGTMPIALGTGAGAELRQPLGVAVVGGLVLSQLLTLYITPVIYLYLDRFDRMLKRRLRTAAEGSRGSVRLRSRRNRLQREAGAAAAGSFRLRIFHLERGADQVVDEVDLRAGHVVHRHRIDQHHRAVTADDEIVGRLRTLHVELVLKARAATAFDADAQHGSGRLTLEDFADPSCCPLADRNARAHPCAFSGRSYWQMAQRIVKCAGQ